MLVSSSDWNILLIKWKMNLGIPLNVVEAFAISIYGLSALLKFFEVVYG